jgi:hypothetical protein
MSLSRSKRLPQRALNQRRYGRLHDIYVRSTRVTGAESTVKDSKMRRRVKRRVADFEQRTERLIEELQSNVDRGLATLELLCQGGNPSEDYLIRVGKHLANTGSPSSMIRAILAMKGHRYYHEELWAAAAAVIQDDNRVTMRSKSGRGQILKVVKAHVDLDLPPSTHLLKFAAEKFLPAIREMEEDHYPDFSALLALLADHNLRHDRYVREMAGYFADRETTTAPADVAIICRALATFRLKVEPAMNRAASLLESNWMSYKFSDAQAVMHVFAEFFVKNYAMCDVAVKVFKKYAIFATPDEVTGVVKDFSELRYKNHRFLSKLCEPILTYNIVNYTDEQLSTIAFHLGKLDYNDANIIAALSLELEPKVRDLRGRPLSCALQGLERLGTPAKTESAKLLESSLAEEESLLEPGMQDSPRTLALDDYEKSVLALSAVGQDTYVLDRPITAPVDFSVSLPRIRALDARPLTAGSPRKPAQFRTDLRPTAAYGEAKK